MRDGPDRYGNGFCYTYNPSEIVGPDGVKELERLREFVTHYDKSVKANLVQTVLEDMECGSDKIYSISIIRDAYLYPCVGGIRVNVSYKLSVQQAEIRTIHVAKMPVQPYEYLPHPKDLMGRLKVCYDYLTKRKKEK